MTIVEVKEMVYEMVKRGRGGGGERGGEEGEGEGLGGSENKKGSGNGR